VVQEGVLYRGGQPDAGGLEYIASRYGIRTVVNLRGPAEAGDWWKVEQDVCRKLGLHLVNVSISSDDTVVSGIKHFLTVATDSANYPIFVHCQHGSARTGYVVVAYRIVVQGWRYEDAFKEARKFRFRPETGRNDKYDIILIKLAAGADWRKLSDSATSSPASAPTGQDK
jgi:protein tyrosine/serine phosphatase